MPAREGSPRPAGLGIRLLGGLAVEVDGEPRALPSLSAARSLLGLLALEGRPLPRGQLAARFWPDVLDESARTSLRTALSAIRRCLGEGALTATRESVALEVAWTDVAEFDRLIAAGRPEEALELYRGPLLAGLDDDWIYERRDELRDRVGQALAKLAAAAEQAGDDEAAIEHTRRWAALDPLDEAPVRELMRRLAAAGDRPGAIAAYSRLSERLRAQLAIAPAAATREAAAALRAEDAAVPEVHAAAPAGGVVALLFTDLVGSTEMIGRLGEDEADRLRREHFRVLGDVIAGHGGDQVKNLGDGLMAVFTSIVDAVRCSVVVQQSVARLNERSPEALRVRVGINAGEPFRSEGDWFGTPVVVAKRLCDHAEGSQILVSRLVRELIGGRGGFHFRDAGVLDLKGLGSPVAAAQVEWAVEPAAALTLPAQLVDPDAVELIGRGADLQRLRDAWSQARTGRPRAALIGGDPGIGKTRLSSELCRLAHEEGALVLFGRCDEQALAPYQPFVEALDRYAEEVPSDELRLQTGDERGVLARLVPAIGRRLAAPASEPSGEPESERFRLFQAVTRLLGEAARARPAILVLDDLHWADEPTLLLLGHVLREAGDAPLLVVGTYRVTELAPVLTAALAALRRLRAVEEIRLSGLDHDGVEALIAARTGGEREVDVAAVHERTEGNPYFVEEVVRTRPGQALPRSVEDLIGRRLAQLDERAARTLDAGAVVGAEFDVAVLAAVTGLGEDDVIDDLERAVAASTAREVPAAPGRFGFAHALVRETVYARMSSARRARLHQRVGETLEATPEAVPAIVAHHFLAAGALERAFMHTIAAARAARGVPAGEAAAQRYDQALQLAERLGRDASEDAGVRELLMERAELRHEMSDFRGSAEDTEAALTAARATGDRRAELRALNQLGYVRREFDMAAALPCHGQALAIARELGDVDGEILILNRLALLQVNRLAFDEALAAGERALALARESADTRLVARALDALKLAAQWLGELDRLEELTDELLELLGADQPWYRGFAMLERAFVPIGRRDWALAGQRLDEAAALAARAGSWGLRAVVDDGRCWLYREQGRLEEAIAAGRASVTAIRGGGGQFTGGTAATLATALLADDGIHEAIDVLEQALPVARRVSAPAEILRCAGQLAWARSLAGDAEAAAAAAAESEQIIERATPPRGGTFLLGAHGILGAARARLAAGDGEAAARLAEPVLAAAERSRWHEFAEAASAVLAYASGQNTS